MEELIKRFLTIEPGSGYGSGYGYGSGSGYGYGSGYGDGSGDGDGSGSGSGYGYGSGYGDGSGSGYGYGSGSGSGYGYGYGDGSGSGSGYGDGVKAINGELIFNIDDTPTLIDQVRGTIAKGRIFSRDLTLTPCFIVRQNDLFAHGKTLRNALDALNDKLFEDMPEEERIEAFMKVFEQGKEYPNTMFFDWHNKLTGSCEAGRNAFAKDHDIDLNDSMTVERFMQLTRDSFGRDVILKVIEAYKTV